MDMYLHKNLLIFVLILFCDTSMYPQNADQVSNQDQIDLELHNIISKYETLKYEDSIKFALLEFKLNELKDSIANYKSGDNASSLSDSIKKKTINNRIEELKEKSIGQPVILNPDTFENFFSNRSMTSSL